MAGFNEKFGGNIRDEHIFETDHPYFASIGLSVFTTGTLSEWLLKGTDKEPYVNFDHFPDGDVDIKLDENGNTKSVSYIGKMLGITEDTEFYWNGWKPNKEVINDGRYKPQNLHGLSANVSEAGGFSNTGGDEENAWEFDGVIQAGIPDLQDALDNISLDGCGGNCNDQSGGGGGDSGMYGFPITQVVASFGCGGESGDQDPRLVPKAYVDKTAPVWFAKAEDGAVETGDAPWDSDPFKLLYGIIQLNKYMNDYTDFFGPDTWDLEDCETHPGLTKEQAFSSFTFLNEIKSAKGGRPVISWSGDVTFIVKIPDILVGDNEEGCEITENVTFRLYLSDRTMFPGNVDKNKSVTMKNLILVKPKTDVTGRQYNTHVDGAMEATAITDVTTNAAAELETSYNPVTRKFESGSANLFAIMATNVGRCSAPAFNNVIAGDIAEYLDGEDPEFRFTPASGLAIPIRVQNNNVMQWQPNYRDLGIKCSGNSDERQTVKAFNFNPNKSYASGDSVLLSKIDGVWHITDLGAPDASGVDDDPTVSAGIGKWGSFNYLISNTDCYFRAFDSNKLYEDALDRNNRTYDSSWLFPYNDYDAERNFHVRYYNNTDSAVQNIYNQPQRINDHIANWRINYNDTYGDGSAGYDSNWNTFGQLDSAFQKMNSSWGFFQQTSFDYLDSQVGGLRATNLDGYAPDPAFDKCSINTTNAGINAAEQPYPQIDDPQGDTPRNSAHGGLFFGCVFPDGYEDTGDFKPDGGRDYDCVSEYDAGLLEGRIPALDGFEPKYLIDIIPKGTSPFDKTEEPDGRNVARAAVDQPNPLGEVFNKEWQRRSPYKGPSIFQRNENMNNMPADVMLLASHSGVNGSPIRPISRTYYFHRDPGGAGDNVNLSTDVVSESVKAAFAGNWYAKKRGDADFDANESAFDFAPIQPNRITFKPLKMEALQGIGIHYLHNNDPVERSNISANINEIHQTTMKGWYAEHLRTMWDNQPAISAHTITREALGSQLIRYGNCWESIGGQHLIRFGWVSQKYKGNFGRVHDRFWLSDSTDYDGGFQWANPNSDPVLNDGFLGGFLGHPYYEYYPDGTRVDPNDYSTQFSAYRDYGWGESIAIPHVEWDRGLGGDAPMPGCGAVGVITTNVKVKANQAIVFSTDNFYGQGYISEKPWRAADPVEHRPSWGTNIAEYGLYERNCPSLHAKVYHGHPEDQIVFDATTFAVHHFNPGMRYTDGKYLNTEGEFVDIPIDIDKPDDLGPEDGQFIDNTHRNHKRIRFTDATQFDEQPIDEIFYDYPVPSASTDFTVPSRYAKFLNGPDAPNDGGAHVDQGLYNPVPVTSNTWACKDLCFDFNLNPDDNKSPGLMDEKYWVVDPRRTGKLLPYAYARTRLGISQLFSSDPLDPVTTEWVFQDINSNDATPPQAFKMLDEETLKNYPDESDGVPNNYRQVKNLLSNLIVKDAGENYAVNDFVGINQYNLLFRVEEVTEEGAISKLVMVRNAEGLTVGQFPNSDDTVGNFTGNVKLDTITTENGGKFSAYFVAGYVYENYLVDKKPKIVKVNGAKLSRLSSDAKQSPEQNPPAGGEKAGAFVSESDKKIDVDVTGENESEDRQYDCFFHFHNWPSMTWNSTGQQNEQGSRTTWNGSDTADFPNSQRHSDQFISVAINAR